MFSVLIWREDQQGCFQFLSLSSYTQESVAAADIQDLSRKAAGV